MIRPHGPPPRTVDAVVFDLDGTLIDSDAALAGAFIALGIAPDHITYGHVIADECARLGLSLEAYLEAYDTGVVLPFPGVEEMLGELGRWAVCSNKHPRSGQAELARLRWRPEVALFADSFAGPKHLGPVLNALDLPPEAVLYVGDTVHDHQAAAAVGCRFAWAGWNPRCRPGPGDEVARDPGHVIAVVQGQSG